LSLSWFPLFPFGETETTKEAKDTKTLRRKGHPQIAQIFTDDLDANVMSICDNLRNLWTKPFHFHLWWLDGFTRVTIPPQLDTPPRSG
jgi:hypothetical protein